MRIGDEVFHPKYGKGTIKVILPNPAGSRIKVDFGYAKPILPASELERTPGGPPLAPVGLSPPEPTSPGEKINRLDPATLLARQGIQALKLGQILDVQVESLSVGMEKLQQDLTQALTRAATGRPTFSLITGAWGSGKSHALTLLETLARQQSFATSTVIMDGYSLSLARPMELLQEVMGNLIVPQQEGMDGVMVWLREVLKKNMTPRLQKRAPLLGKALESLPIGVLDDPEISQVFTDYLSLDMTAAQAKYRLGRLKVWVTGLPTLKAHRLVERAAAFTSLLENWAHFAKIMGAQGLLVIFDELDVEYAYTSYDTQYCRQLRERRHELLNALPKIQDAPLLLAFAAVPDLSTGQDSIQKDAIRHLQQVLQHRLATLTVPALKEHHFRELFGKLDDLYLQAYPSGRLRLTAPQRDQLCDILLAHQRRDPQPLPRKFVRLCLEALDVLNAAEAPPVETFMGAIQ